MNVVSLFDGIRCGYLALENAGVKVDKYFASEIDQKAIDVAREHYPSAIDLGDIQFVTAETFSLHKIGLLIGGSPCQSFSRGGDQTGFDGTSRLFWEYVRILKDLRVKNPDILFLLENVKMRKEWELIISEALGVQPVRINSNLVSAQTRDRLYWTNIGEIQQPEDRDISINEILQQPESPNYISYDYIRNSEARLMMDERDPYWRIPEATKKGYIDVRKGQAVDLTFIKSKTRRGRAMFKKSNCLTASSQLLAVYDGTFFRYLTPEELERLQTLPEGWTASVSDTQRRKMIGNGWNIETLTHIFKHIDRHKDESGCYGRPEWIDKL